MRAIITLENGTEYEFVSISKDRNKLTIEFLDIMYTEVPWEILRKGKFKVEIKPEEHEIDCGDCETCLTPIC